ncbi:MAG: cation transporter [Zoogloeaceae bacterium]|jgi:hypothetical protein|nr:cation transporter [Zoogloeaceae bacterium]
MKEKTTPPADFLRRAADFATIAHHVPGRVRLKLNVKPEDLRDLERSGFNPDALDDFFSSVSGVRRIHLNKLARSITVEYDNQVIPDQFWPNLLSPPAAPEALAFMARLQDARP